MQFTFSIEIGRLRELKLENKRKKPMHAPAGVRTRAIALFKTFLIRKVGKQRVNHYTTGA